MRTQPATSHHKLKDPIPLHRIASQQMTAHHSRAHHVTSRCMTWRCFVALPTFYRQNLSLAYSFFPLKLPPLACPGTTCIKVTSLHEGALQCKQRSIIAQNSSIVGSGFWLLRGTGVRVEPQRVRDALAPPDSYCFAWMSGRKTRLPFTRSCQLALIGQSSNLKLQKSFS